MNTLNKISSRGPPVQHQVSVDGGLVEKVATRLGVEDGQELTKDAHAADEAEHNMTFWQAVKAYPKATMWSMIFSTAIIMEGFDLTLINSFYALPAFQRKFGVETAPGSGDFLITPAWQSGLTNAVQVGSIFGLLLNGFFCDRFGYLRTIGGSLVLITCFIFISFFAVNIEMLLVAELLCGFPWGVFQTLTVSYAADVAPIALRPLLTTYVNLCWVFGQFFSSAVLKGVSTMSQYNQWAYRIPFALQWIWPVPIFVASLFAPESPWHYVRKGRLEDAKRSLQRLGSARRAINADERVAQMVYTNELEKAARAGTSYLDCFKGVNLRRTEIGAIVWIIQNACGAGFIGYSTVFYEQAGLSTANAFSFSLGMYGLGAIGTISSWFSMRAFGRRTLYISGLMAMAVLLFAIGGSGFAEGTGASWAAGSLVVVYSFLYQFTVGPVCYTLVAEIPSTRLRAKGVALSRIFYNISGIISNILFPRMFSPLAWNWKRKSGFFWAGSCILCIVWCYFRLPETKGRSYAELDVLFEDKVSARKFSSTKVNLYNKAEAVTANLAADSLEKEKSRVSHVENR